MKKFYLNEKEAKILLDGFGQRRGGVVIRKKQKSKLVKQLSNIFLLKNFIMTLPQDLHATIDEAERFYTLTLRRIFLNSQTPLDPNQLKNYPNAGKLTLRLLQSPKLRESMKESHQKFSMLAKLRTYDEQNSTVTLSPMFSIPGTNLEKIYELEQEHTKEYSSTRPFIIPNFKETRTETLYDIL